MRRAAAAGWMRVLGVVLLLSTGLAGPPTARGQELAEPTGDAGPAQPDGLGDPKTAAVSPVDYDAPAARPGLSTFLLPLLTVQAVNGAYWLGSRYLIDASWARISAGSAEANLVGGFEWDDNAFKVNQFGHPYQGSSYYGVARAGGLGFWASLPYTFYGSLVWELLMETEQPATNDLITTTIGGAIVGELSYRLANYMLDDSSAGVERGARESLALGLSPVYGITRGLDGRAWRDGAPPVLRPITLDVQLAVHGISDDRGFSELVHEPRIALYYGDVAALDDDFNAFDYMTFEVGADLVDNGELTVSGAKFAVEGLTNGVKFSLLDNRHNAVFGALVEFDYFTNDLLVLGTSGIGPAILSTHRLRGGYKLLTRLAVFAHFGGIEDPYSGLSMGQDGDSKSGYSFGTGANGKLWIRLRHREHGEIFARIRRYNYLLVAGSDGRVFAGLYGLGGQMNLYRGLHVGIEVWATDLEATYDAHPDNTRAILGTVLLLGYRAN